MQRVQNEAGLPVRHPLENQVFLQHIFDFLQTSATFEDWKNIRAVCKTWYFETLSRWRSTAVLNLKFGTPKSGTQPSNPGVSASAFLTLRQTSSSNTLSQLTEHPFQKYKLEKIELDLTNLDANTPENFFWNCIGPSIKHLFLHDINIKTVTRAKTEIVRFLIKKTPNLENLSLSKVRNQGESTLTQSSSGGEPVHPNITSVSLSEYFAICLTWFSNLQDLTLGACGSMQFINILDPKTFPNGRGRLFVNSSVKKLNLVNCDMIYNNDAYGFSNIRFTALQHLSIYRDYRRCKDNELKYLPVLIRNNCQSLQTLEYFATLEKLPSEFCCIDAPLPALTELRAWGNVFKDLTFLRFTPNLKVLHLDLYGFEKQEQMKEERNAGPFNGFPTKRDMVELTRYRRDMKGIEIRLPKLEYFQLNYQLSADSLRALAEWMPNLKTFKSVLTNETLPIVCEKWPELENLECMFGSNVSNENITGGIKTLWDGQQKKCLADMSGLKTFQLHTECDQSCLTNTSVREGFLRIPSLTELRISVSPDFSQQSEILLRRHIPTVYVYRNYLSNPVHKGWKCCREKAHKSYIFISPNGQKESSSDSEGEADDDDDFLDSLLP